MQTLEQHCEELADEVLNNPGDAKSIELMTDFIFSGEKLLAEHETARDAFVAWLLIGEKDNFNWSEAA